jgi:hypothetical protein
VDAWAQVDEPSWDLGGLGGWVDAGS